MGENVIELNGKRYDALTGAYLGKSHVIPKHITDYYVHGKVIDGVMRPQPAKKAAVAAKETPKPAQQKPAAAERHTPATKTHAPANHLKAHHPEHSKTLMRRDAQKPQFAMKTPVKKAHAAAEVMAKPQSALTHKRTVYSVDPARQERAGLVSKHHAVKHFTAGAIHSVSAQVPVIAVQPAPLQLTARSARPTVKHNDIFETAIAHAKSHEQPIHKTKRHHSRKRRLLNSLAVVGTFLVIGGFVGYLNMPGIEMRVASFRAGFGASMPTYTPTGYALAGGVEHSGGTISLSFRSGSSQYRITQQASNWNSQTLLDNTLALNGKHETVQKNGQTIYIYDGAGTGASWVSGGVRYDITGNAQLSEQEIVSIATSL